jgi:hypothetical protein
MSEEHMTEQAQCGPLTEAELALIVGGNTDPDDPPPGKPKAR